MDLRVRLVRRVPMASMVRWVRLVLPVPTVPRVLTESMVFRVLRVPLETTAPTARLVSRSRWSTPRD